MTRDAGISSLSSTARERSRQSAQATAAEIRAEMARARCLGPKCDNLLRPHETGRWFYCSDACREASLVKERGRRPRLWDDEGNKVQPRRRHT